MESSPNIPSLYPVYLRYHDQHVILTTLQSLLEEACFDFAQKSFPQLLEQHGWDCYEAIELTEWTKVLPKYFMHLSQNLTKPFDEVIGLLRELRHSAVHRLRKTAAGIERLAENAQIFLAALNDLIRSQQLTIFRRQIRSTIEELQRNKDLLEGKLRSQLKQIRTKRAELDKWEKESTNNMVLEDQQLVRDIGEDVAMMVESIKSQKTEYEQEKGKMRENGEDGEISLDEVKPQDSMEFQGFQRSKSRYEELSGLEEEEEEFLEAVIQSNRIRN